MKIHYWEKKTMGGRFAITLCCPNGYKGFIEVTEDKKKVTCPSCIKKLSQITLTHDVI